MRLGDRASGAVSGGGEYGGLPYAFAGSWHRRALCAADRGARRTHALDFDDLRRIGVVLKRALYFITCSGRMMYRIPMNEDYILNNILDKNKQKPNGQGEVTYQQLSFDDVSFGMSG